MRGEVEDQQLRWLAGKRRRELLLARGLPLAEARDMAAKYGAELRLDTMAYIDTSRRRANRGLAVAWAVAVVFGLIAVGAGLRRKWRWIRSRSLTATWTRPRRGLKG